MRSKRIRTIGNIAALPCTPAVEDVNTCGCEVWWSARPAGCAARGYPAMIYGHASVGTRASNMMDGLDA